MRCSTPRPSSLLILIVIACGCAEKGPSEELLARAEEVRAESRRLAEAFPAADELTETACPPGLAVHRMTWTDLSRGMSRDGWVNQLGTEMFGDDPQVYNSIRYTREPTERLTRELAEAVALRENATHVRVARVTAVEAGRRTGQDSYVPGHATAWVVTFSRETGEVVCAQRIHEENEGWVSAGDIERQVEGLLRSRVRELR